MPWTVAASLALIGLSALQSAVYAWVATPVEPGRMGLLFLIHTGVLACLLTAMFFRQNWARWVVVLLAVLGFSPVARLLATMGVVPAPSELTVIIVRGLGLAPGYLQMTCNVLAAVLIVLPASVRWFHKKDERFRNLARKLSGTGGA